MLELLQPCAILRIQTWDNTANPPPWPPIATQIVAELAAQNTAELARQIEPLRLGPTDWLLLADPAQAQALLPALTDAFAQTSFRVTDVSSALTRIAVTGPDARALLNKGTALDLDPQNFPPGTCTRTRLANIPVVVRCTDPFTFECIVTRSHEAYFRAWLTDAGQEYTDTP